LAAKKGLMNYREEPVQIRLTWTAREPTMDAHTGISLKRGPAVLLAH